MSSALFIGEINRSLRNKMCLSLKTISITSGTNYNNNNNRVYWLRTLVRHNAALSAVVKTTDYSGWAAPHPLSNDDKE